MIEKCFVNYVEPKRSPLDCHWTFTSPKGCFEFLCKDAKKHHIPPCDVLELLKTLESEGYFETDEAEYIERKAAE